MSYGPVCDPAFNKALDAWLPTSTPGSAAFFGVDRSAPVRRRVTTTSRWRRRAAYLLMKLAILFDKDIL